MRFKGCTTVLVLSLVVWFFHAEAGAQSTSTRTYSLATVPVGLEPEPGGTRYVAQAGDCTIIAGPGEIQVRFPGGNSANPSEVVTISLENARATAAIPDRPLPGVINYYPDAIPGHWRTDVRRYEQVRFPGVYPSIHALV